MSGTSFDSDRKSVVCNFLGSYRSLFLKDVLCCLSASICVSVWRSVHVSSGAHRGQKKSNSQDMELQVPLSHPTWMLESKRGSSARAVTGP